MDQAYSTIAHCPSTTTQTTTLALAHAGIGPEVTRPDI